MTRKIPGLINLISKFADILIVLDQNHSVESNRLVNHQKQNMMLKLML